MLQVGTLIMVFDDSDDGSVIMTIVMMFNYCWPTENVYTQKNNLCLHLCSYGKSVIILRSNPNTTYSTQIYHLSKSKLLL